MKLDIPTPIKQNLLSSCWLQQIAIRRVCQQLCSSVYLFSPLVAPDPPWDGYLNTIPKHICRSIVIDYYQYSSSPWWFRWFSWVWVCTPNHIIPPFIDCCSCSADVMTTTANNDLGLEINEHQHRYTSNQGTESDMQHYQTENNSFEPRNALCINILVLHGELNCKVTLPIHKTSAQTPNLERHISRKKRANKHVQFRSNLVRAFHVIVVMKYRYTRV